MKKADVVVESHFMCDLDNCANANKSPFDVLDVPLVYTINVSDLLMNCRRLQQKYHPDCFPKGSNEAQLACYKLQCINKCAALLRDPLLRAKEMLLLRGCKVPGEDGVPLQVDPVVMMQEMERREAIDEASNNEVLQNFKIKLRNELDVVEESFQIAFDTQNKDGLLSSFNKLSYLLKANDAILAKEKTFTSNDRKFEELSESNDAVSNS